MAEEIMEAVQIIRVAYEGIEIAIRIGSGGLNAAQRVVETLIGLFEYEKTMARINAQMVPQLQTVFLTPPADLENVSSSLIRGFVGQPDWQRWVSPHVTPAVLRLMEEREQ